MSNEPTLVSLWSHGGCHSIPDEYTRNNSNRCDSIGLLFS